MIGLGSFVTVINAIFNKKFDNNLPLNVVEFLDKISIYKDKSVSKIGKDLFIEIYEEFLKLYNC